MNAITPVRPIMTCDGPLPYSDDADPNHGGCFCGAVEIEVSGSPVEMGYCHCSSCRAYSGNPVKAFKLFRAEQLRVVRGAEFLGSFSRSDMSDRKFCKLCGGHLMTAHPGLGFIDVQAHILPGIAFVPVVHLNYVQSVLPMKDGLPKLWDFPAAAGGSGELVWE